MKKFVLAVATLAVAGASLMYAQEKGIWTNNGNSPAVVKKTTINVEPAKNPFLGLSSDITPISVPTGPFLIFPASNFRTAGVGLRNKTTGVLELDGLPVFVGPTPVTSYVFLYWSVITSSAIADPSIYGTVNLRRLPDPPSFDGGTGFYPITGFVAGVSPQPCWGNLTSITTFVGIVSTSLVSRNGHYQIQLSDNQRGLTGGLDPWQYPSPIVGPLWEGASLVAITSRTNSSLPGGTVVIYNPATTLGTTGPYDAHFILRLPIPAPLGGQALFDHIWADGQKGDSLQGDITPVANEITAVNGNSIAGYLACSLPQAAILLNDCSSDLNGSTASPGPLLWDDHSHDISSLVPAGQTALDVEIVASLTPTDCVTAVTFVVEYQ